MSLNFELDFVSHSLFVGRTTVNRLFLLRDNALVSLSCHNSSRCLKQLFPTSSKYEVRDVSMVGLLVKALLSPCRWSPFLLCSHISQRDRENERQRASSSPHSLLVKALLPSQGLYLTTSSESNCSPQTLLLIPSHWELGLQHTNVGSTH